MPGCVIRLLCVYFQYKVADFDKAASPQVPSDVTRTGETARLHSFLRVVVQHNSSPNARNYLPEASSMKTYRRRLTEDFQFYHVITRAPSSPTSVVHRPSQHLSDGCSWTLTHNRFYP